MEEGLVRNEDGVTRCRWGGGEDLAYRAYHDDEWGRPLHAAASVFTIHNLAHQGLYPRDVLPTVGLGETRPTPSRASAMACCMY